MIDDNGGGGIRMFIDDDKKTTNAFTLLMCAGLKQDKISKEEWRGQQKTTILVQTTLNQQTNLFHDFVVNQVPPL